MASVTSTSSSALGSFLNSTALTSIGGSSNNSGLASSLAVSGLASGMNWQNVVTELANAERGAETPWKNQQSALNTQNSAYDAIKASLGALQTDVQALQDPALYEGALAQSSDSTIASASAVAGAALGTFTFNIKQLATAAQINGQGNISKGLVPDGNPADVTLGTAGFATPITDGTFTINGATVTIAATDTLQDVFNKISTATNGAVTAGYDAGSDAITLSSSGAIVLGSATDTSNFLQVAQLFNANETSNSGTDSIASAGALGRVSLSATLASANLQGAVTDAGASSQGAFTINGVTINYDANADNLQNVLDRINNSTAGVVASYDPLNNRFVLANKVTGDLGISLKDVTGHFLTATGLTGGSFQSGQNLLYTLNNSSTQLVSQSNTITAASSGITGLSVTALQQQKSVTVTVASDTSKVTSAVQQFITDYNSVQNYISAQQIVSTGSDGTVTPGTLTGDLTASNIASDLRSSVFSPASGLPGAIQMLSDLGIQTNGQDNTLKLSDSTALNNALAGNLNGVKSFFTDAASGWTTQVNHFLNATIGDDGSLTNHQASLTLQSNNLATQIANLEKKISSDSDQWTKEFQAMEQAQAQVNQELTYLSEQVAKGSL